MACDFRLVTRDCFMVIGILQVELTIHDAQSLKDKRRVVSSLSQSAAKGASSISNG